MEIKFIGKSKKNIKKMQDTKVPSFIMIIIRGNENANKGEANLVEIFPPKLDCHAHASFHIDLQYLIIKNLK